MNPLLKFSAFLLLLTIFACKKDCTAPPIDQNIVGTWSANVSFGGVSKSGDVIFRSDHTGTSPGEIFQGSFNNNTYEDFTWEIEGDTTLFFHYGTGQSSFGYGYKIKENNCDKIKVNYFFTDCNMYRK